MYAALTIELRFELVLLGQAFQLQFQVGDHFRQVCHLLEFAVVLLGQGLSFSGEMFGHFLQFGQLRAAAAAAATFQHSDVRRMNEVNARRARLVLGWVTVFGRVYHLRM